MTAGPREPEGVREARDIPHLGGWRAYLGEV